MSYKSLSLSSEFVHLQIRWTFFREVWKEIGTRTQRWSDWNHDIEKQYISNETRKDTGISHFVCKECNVHNVLSWLQTEYATTTENIFYIHKYKYIYVSPKTVLRDGSSGTERKRLQFLLHWITIGFAVHIPTFL